MGYIDVEAAKAEAIKLLKEKEDLYERLSIVRSDLRNAVTTKSVTPEQRQWINDTFPVVTRNRSPKTK